MKLNQPTDAYTAERCRLQGCADCSHTWDGNPEDGEEVGRCPSCRSNNTDWVWHPGVRCPNCKTLDYTQPVDRTYCSRACMLQWEYAEGLKAQAT